MRSEPSDHFRPSRRWKVQVRLASSNSHFSAQPGAIEAIRSVAEDFRSKIRMYPFHIVSDRLPNAVTPLSPNNPDVSAHHLFEVLMAEYDIVICPNGGDLKDTLFRVGHIGAHTTEDNDILLRAFDDLMARGILKA